MIDCIRPKPTFAPDFRTKQTIDQPNSKIWYTGNEVPANVHPLVFLERQ